MDAAIKSNWLSFVSEKQSLGQMVGLDEFAQFKKHWDLGDAEMEELKNYWIGLCQYSFLDDDLVSNAEEIQGHGLGAFDLLTSEKKILIQTTLEPTEWDLLLQNFCLMGKIDWNNLHPFVSFSTTFKNRPCRISLQHASLSPNHLAKIFIRFHIERDLKLIDFLEESENYPLERQLLQAVQLDKNNILICGPTGSGKTTLLRTLAHAVSEEEHLICIEDTPELHLKRSRLTTMVAQAQQYFENNISMDQLCTYAMRMTPDRLILGEIRGKEIISLSLLLNTGHQGLLSTVHASSCVDALNRLALLFCLYQKDGQSFNFPSVLKFLTKQFHKVIFIKNKKIQEVVSLIGADEGNIFFETLFKKN